MSDECHAIIEEVGEGDEESAACAFALKPPLFFPLLPLKPDASFVLGGL